MESCLLKPLQLFILMFTLTVVNSCANTKLTSVWMNDKMAGKSYHDLLIIGIGEHEHNRRLFEEHFTDQLKASGIGSEVSYNMLPEGIEINRDTVITAIKGKNIDAVIVTHMVGVDKETVYRENMDYIPTRGYYNGLYNYYPYVHTYVHQPGYYTTYDIVTLETNLYEVKSEDLVWSAHSKTFAPDSAADVINDLVKLVIKDLQQKDLIKSK